MALDMHTHVQYIVGKTSGDERVLLGHNETYSQRRRLLGVFTAGGRSTAGDTSGEGSLGKYRLQTAE